MVELITRRLYVSRLNDLSQSASAKLINIREKVSSSPENVFFRFSYAQQLSTEDRLEEAVKQLNICLNSKSDWMMAVFLKSKLELRLGRNSDAIDSLKKTIELARIQQHEDPLSEATEMLNSLTG